MYISFQPQSHNEFKELVDKLLTEFLEDLGVTAEKFYEVCSRRGVGIQLRGYRNVAGGGLQDAVG